MTQELSLEPPLARLGEPDIRARKSLQFGDSSSGAQTAVLWSGTCPRFAARAGRARGGRDGGVMEGNAPAVRGGERAIGCDQDWGPGWRGGASRTRAGRRGGGGRVARIVSSPLPLKQEEPTFKLLSQS